MYNNFSLADNQLIHQAEKFPVHSNSLKILKYGEVDNPLGIWCEIECSAGEFLSKKLAKDRFQSEFLATDTFEISSRCFFLFHDNKAVATATAWYGEFEGEPAGRLHWVAVKKEFQGRGFSKIIVSEALSYLREYYSLAYLTTQPSSFKAIKIYLREGFTPLLESDADKKVWESVLKLI